jgi:hypothetical protein
MFVAAFTHRGGRRWYQLMQRYEEFRPEDIIVICEWHHREIHELYWLIVMKHMKRLKLTPRDFSWKQADILMRDLAKCCDRWLKVVTPGSPPWTEEK